MVALPKPKRESADEIVLDRAEWEEFAEELADMAALLEADQENAAYAAALPPGRQATMPLAVALAREEGAHPLKAWREHRGLRQQALAEKAGVSRDMIAQIETGKRDGSIATLDRLAAALGVPIDALVMRE